VEAQQEPSCGRVDEIASGSNRQAVRKSSSDENSWKRHVARRSGRLKPRERTSCAWGEGDSGGGQQKAGGPDRALRAAPSNRLACAMSAKQRPARVATNSPTTRSATLLHQIGRRTNNSQRRICGPISKGAARVDVAGIGPAPKSPFAGAAATAITSPISPDKTGGRRRQRHDPGNKFRSTSHSQVQAIASGAWRASTAATLGRRGCAVQRSLES